MKTIRRVAEKVSRNRTLLRHIEVDGSKQPLYVSPDAQLKYLKMGAAAFDQDLIQLVETHLQPGWHVWDIGANVGTFFVAAASKVGSEGSVLAVEADPWLAGILDRTVQLPAHSDKDMRVLCAAASKGFGVAEFLIAARGRASNALAEAGGRGQMGGVRYKKPVPTIPMDYLLEISQPPNMIKIDVEGAEELVLQGMTNVLKTVRPIVYSEVGEDQFEPIVKMMSDLAYTCCLPNGEETSRHISENYLFVPQG